MLFVSFRASRIGLAALAAALFCRMLGVFILLPVAAPLVSALPDGDALSAGLVLGGYGLTQALLQLPIGMLADKFGKKPVMLAALALFAAGGFAAAAAESAAGMVGGRLLQGMGAVAAVTAAWIADIAPPHRRAPAMAAFGGVIALAFVVTLFLAPLAVGWVGLAGVFEISGWLGVASFLLVLTLPPPPLSAQDSAAPPMLSALSALLRNRELMKIALGAFALHYALATLFFILPTTLPLPTAQHWQAYAPGFVAAIAPAWWLISRVERQPARCLKIAVALVFAGTVLLPAAEALAAAGAAVLAFFAGFMALEAALPALAARAVPAAARASAMGVVMSCEFASVFLGGAMAGALAQVAPQAGGGAAVAVAALLLAGWFFVIAMPSAMPPAAPPAAPSAAPSAMDNAGDSADK